MNRLEKKQLYESDSDDEDLQNINDDDYDEEDDFENVPVKGLFSDKTYPGVREMFKSELDENKFNLIQIINKYSMNQIDYIKMINYIRSQVGILKK